MDILQNILENNPAANRTLLFSLGFFLTFVVLLYFYILSTYRDNAKTKNQRGLMAMAFIFFFYTIMGFTYIFTYPENGVGPQSEFLRPYLFLLSGCVTICFILMIPFFSRGSTKLDEWSELRLWNYLALLIGILYISSLYVNPSKLHYIDLPITLILMVIIGIFVVWDFERRDMKFAGYLVGALIMGKVMIQILIPEIKGENDDKFDHVNICIMFPAMIEAIIAITISFTWINELKYKKLAQIYLPDIEDSAVQEYFDKKSTMGDLKNDWRNQIGKDRQEEAIQSMILFLEKRNEHFATILSIASRNNRINTQQMRGVLTVEEYHISKNKINADLLDLIQLI